MNDENVVNHAAQEEAEHQIDPELEAKHKTLSLLTHGAKCTATQNGNFACTFHHCKAAKTMLQHVVNCQLPPGSCPVPFCAMAKYVLANAADIQIQMAKANKRGRGFQRTMLSNHRAMTASVARTRSRSGSRGPPTQRRPLTTVYESNDEGEGVERGERNATIRTVSAKASSLVKPRVSDSSGTADTDSFDEDSSEEEESMDEESEDEGINKAVPTKVAATHLRRPYPQPRKICSPPDKESSESESSSEGDEGGFGMPGSVSQTQKRVVPLGSDYSNSNEYNGGFGCPGSVEAQQKLSERENSDSDDDEGGFGVPGTPSKREEKEADSNSSNDNDNGSLDNSPLRSQADTRDPNVGSDSGSSNDKEFGFSNKAASMNEHMENKDNDDDEVCFGLSVSVPPQQELTKPKNSDSEDAAADDGDGFGVPDTSCKKEKEATPNLSNQNGSALFIKQPDARESDEDSDLASSDNKRLGLPSNVSTEKEQEQLTELPDVDEVRKDDWSSDEEEELKVALANRDIELAQKLMMEKDEKDEPPIKLSKAGLPDKDTAEETRETGKQTTVLSRAEGNEPNSQENVAHDTSSIAGSKEAKEVASSPTASENVLGNGKDMLCTHDQEEQPDASPVLHLSDHQPQKSEDGDWSSDEDGELKTALANCYIELAEQLMKKAEHALSDFQETQEDSPLENKSGEEYQTRDTMLDTEDTTIFSQDIMPCQSRDNDRVTSGASNWTTGRDGRVSCSATRGGGSCWATGGTRGGANCWTTDGASNWPGCRGTSWASIAKEESQDPDTAVTTCVTGVPIHDSSNQTAPDEAAQSQHSAKDSNISVEIISTYAKPVFQKRAEDINAEDGKSPKTQISPSDPSDNNSRLMGQYGAIRFKSAVGSLSLFKDCLVFEPNDSSAESLGGKLTLCWMEVTKHQRTPVTHAKALLKLMLTSGKCLTFEFQERDDLFKCRKVITSVLREYRAAAGAADTNVVPTESIYEAVRFRSMVGTMTLGKGSLVYNPNKDSTGRTTSSVLKFTLGWEEVSKHQVSPATHEKHLLKFLLNSGKALTFELESRVELVKARKEITQLLREHQPTMNNSMKSCATSNNAVSMNTN